MIDVAVIGGGVIGAAVAYELSKKKLSVALIERDNDVANRTTKANSAIVHAGYDPIPGSLMARLNVKGCEMMPALCKKLDVSYKNIGSIVVGFDENDRKTIETLFERGNKNGVPGLEILSGDEVKKREPNLAKEVCCALWAPSAGIINPWELCVALSETASKNGVDFMLSSEVTDMKKIDGGFEISINGDKKLKAKYVVNAAGTYSDKIHNMVSAPAFTIRPVKGEYYLMDKEAGTLVNTVVFQCPSKAGKGVLVSPTVHGNLIVGPNAEDIKSPDDVAVTADALELVRTLALRSVPSVNVRQSIRNFAGVRAHCEFDDFIIQEAPDAKGFIDLAAIASPGLSSAPAIALECLDLLQKGGLSMQEKESFVDERHVVRFNHLSIEEQAALIEKNPLYGRVICRCEVVTEGEIVDALHRPLAPASVDGIKRRCSCGMGRCQGGFCGPRVQEIIARELKIPMEKVLMGNHNTNIIVGETKGGAR